MISPQGLQPNHSFASPQMNHLFLVVCAGLGLGELSCPRLWLVGAKSHYLLVGILEHGGCGGLWEVDEHFDGIDEYGALVAYPGALLAPWSLRSSLGGLCLHCLGMDALIAMCVCMWQQKSIPKERQIFRIDILHHDFVAIVVLPGWHTQSPTSTHFQACLSTIAWCVLASVGAWLHHGALFWITFLHPCSNQHEDMTAVQQEVSRETQEEWRMEKPRYTNKQGAMDRHVPTQEWEREWDIEREREASPEKEKQKEMMLEVLEGMIARNAHGFVWLFATHFASLALCHCMWVSGQPGLECEASQKC